MGEGEPIPLQYARRTPNGRFRLVLRILICALAIGLAASLAPRRLCCVRSGPPDSPCYANLRLIGRACLIYAERHNGRLPPNLQILTQGGNQQPLLPKNLFCPLGGRPYLYIPGQTTQDDPRNVLAYEPVSNHGGAGGNMLRLDGSCKWQTARTQAIELAGTRKRLAQSATQPSANEPG
jgi:hypothetical protein